MSRRLVLLSIPLLLVAGCAAPGGAIYHGATRDRMCNLALGPTADHAWLATRIGGRTDWPAVETGLRLDSVTYYNEIIYDEESHYDRHGSLTHITETAHMGMWVR